MCCLVFVRIYLFVTLTLHNAALSFTCHCICRVGIYPCYNCRSLQRTLDDLKDYQAKYAQLQAQQERLQSEQASPDTKLQQQLAYETFMNREREIAMGYGTCNVSDR